jgi:hypothetical protein
MRYKTFEKLCDILDLPLDEHQSLRSRQLPLAENLFIVLQELVDLGFDNLPGKCRGEIIWKRLDVRIVKCHVIVLRIVGVVVLLTNVIIERLPSLEQKQ